MSATFQATTLERAIARRLGEWREPTTMSLAEVSRKVGFSTAKLSKIENALQIISADDLLALALIYGVPQSERHALYREAQRAEQKRALTVLGAGRRLRHHSRLHRAGVRGITRPHLQD